MRQSDHVKCVECGMRHHLLYSFISSFLYNFLNTGFIIIESEWIDRRVRAGFEAAKFFLAFIDAATILFSLAHHNFVDPLRSWQQLQSQQQLNYWHWSKKKNAHSFLFFVLFLIIFQISCKLFFYSMLVRPNSKKKIPNHQQLSLFFFHFIIIRKNCLCFLLS